MLFNMTYEVFLEKYSGKNVGVSRCISIIQDLTKTESEKYYRIIGRICENKDFGSMLNNLIDAELLKYLGGNTSLAVVISEIYFKDSFNEINNYINDNVMPIDKVLPISDSLEDESVHLSASNFKSYISKCDNSEFVDFMALFATEYNKRFGKGKLKLFLKLLEK